MAILRRALTAGRTWRSVPVRQTLNPNPPPRAFSPHLPFPSLLCHRTLEHQFHTTASEIVLVGLAAGLTALGVRSLAQTSANLAKFSAFLESVVGRELRLQATDRTLAHALNDSYLDSKDIDISKPALRFIPSAVEGQKVLIKFQIPATRDAAQLIANIASDLGLIIECGGLHAHCHYLFPCRSAIFPCELCQSSLLANMLARPDKMKETGGEGGDLRIQVFRYVLPFSDRFEIEFVKDGVWSLKEVDALVSTFTSQLAGGKIEPAERQMNGFAAPAD